MMLQPGKAAATPTTIHTRSPSLSVFLPTINVWLWLIVEVGAHPCQVRFQVLSGHKRQTAIRPAAELSRTSKAKQKGDRGLRRVRAGNCRRLRRARAFSELIESQGIPKSVDF